MISSPLSSPPTSPKFPPISPRATNHRRLTTAYTAVETAYDVLGISSVATNDEIKAAYRRLARSCHPDVPGARDDAGDVFIQVNAAYSTLSDPKKRVDYDRGLFLRQPRFSGVSSSSISYSSTPRKNWESDQCW